MTVNVKNPAELYEWNKQFFSIGGIWPLDPTFSKFYICYAYFICRMMLLIADFINVFGSMPLMIANLLETFIDLMVGVKIILMRHSPSLCNILQEILADLNEDNYRDETEKKLYMEYNRIGKSIFRIGGYTGFFTCVFYHFKPMQDILIAVIHNETIPFNMPYRMYLFFDITDARIYALVYLAQTPVFYYHLYQAISVFFFCNLIVHAAGEMSILAYRIRQINSLDTMKGNSHLGNVFRDIVIRHRKIISFVTLIDDVFNIVLLEELVIFTVLIGLTAYSVLTVRYVSQNYYTFPMVLHTIYVLGVLKADGSSLSCISRFFPDIRGVTFYFENWNLVSFTEFGFLAMYTTTVILMTFTYCMNGEYLIRESINIHDAYYECQWYDMPSTYRKNLIICMARAKIPLQLTAGRFYIFSLSQFSGVLKTAMAYISMLRAVV